MFVENGTFVGGFGQIYKENDKWQFEYQGYLGGVNKKNYKFIVLYDMILILNMNKLVILQFLQQSFLIGRIYNIKGNRVPIVGFFFTNEDNFFIGRIMSFFGPAPYIWGELLENSY